MVDFYAAKEGLLPAEEALLSRLGAELKGRAILDLGVGAGRTIPALSALAGRYVGVDSSPAMVDRCRARYPGVDIRLGDAVRLDAFPAGSFDAVFFTFNGIDHAGPQDRLRILREVRRLLRTPGIFVFSSHNLDAPRRSAWVPRFAPSRHPVQRLASYGRGVVNYLRHRRRELRGEGFAVVVDEVHDFGTLMYYTTVSRQVGQLADLGFSGIEAVCRDGTPLPPGARCRDPWIYYVARKL